MSVDASGPRRPRPAPDSGIPVPVVPAPGPGPAGASATVPGSSATTPGASGASQQRPSDNALRRVLARARDGKALDRDEAATLMQARGEQLATLLGHAARVRDAGLVQ